MTPVLVNITSSRGNTNQVRIEIIDAVSRCVVVSVEISPKQFALGAVCSMGHRPAMGEFRFAKLGQISEHKEEFVLQELHPRVHESDGWTARMDDFVNHHKRENRANGWGYRVTYFRYVDPKPEDLARILKDHESKMAEEERS